MSIDQLKTLPEQSSDSSVNDFMRDSPVYQALNTSTFDPAMSDTDPFVADRRCRAEKGLSRFQERDPELFRQLTKLGVDCVHGSISWNLESIIERGIMPSGTMKQMGVVALGRETMTQPGKRQEVYVVSLEKAEQTVRYSDQRASGENTESVHLGTYKNMLDVKQQYVDAGLWNNSDSNIMKAFHEDAEALRDAIERGEISATENPFPVVCGVSSESLHGTDVVATGSYAVEHELKVHGIVDQESIKALFVPEERVEEVQKRLQQAGIAWSVIDIQRLRIATDETIIPFSRKQSALMNH